MKKFILQIAILVCTSSLFAQWIPVNNGLPDFPPTTIVNWLDTMVVSTYGGGIYLTYDQGENWSEMPGVLPNLFVNNIEYGGGQFDPIPVCTQGGPFICVNGGYVDCNGTGLTNNDVHYWGSGVEAWDLLGDGILGTKGDGLFISEYTSPFIYEWTPFNPGISGNGLFINDGIVTQEWAWLATEGGAYYASFGDTEWSPSNNGLSGDALKINTISFMGYWVISTDGGLYYAITVDDTWNPIFTDEKFNISFFINTDISPSGYMVYAFGENGYYSEDFKSWTTLDFGGIEGEISAASADTTYLYLGFTVEEGENGGSGGLYKRRLEQFVVGIDDETKSTLNSSIAQNFPNPFGHSTKITYALDKSGFVDITMYNISGKKVKTLVHDYHAVGTYTITVDGNDLKDGIYFYTLSVGETIVETRRMIKVQ